jgi:ribosomal protein S4
MAKAASSAANESDYTRQLRAKQKARRVYGVLERQFRRYYEVSLQRRGMTGLNLLQILESRLDNVVYRLGYASSRAQARLLVTHGHFSVNGRRTDVSLRCFSRKGDVVEVREGSRSRTYFKDAALLCRRPEPFPNWVNRDTKNLSGTVCACPNGLRSMATCKNSSSLSTTRDKSNGVSNVLKVVGWHSQVSRRLTTFKRVSKDEVNRDRFRKHGHTED